MKNIILSDRTAADIDAQIIKVLNGLGNPEPPLDLRFVRELLRLDRQYYSSSATGPLAEKISRLKIAGKQVIERPTLLFDAIRKLDLKALYLPDRKRILLDETLPPLKHRWNEAHEIGHSLIEWHADSMLGDTQWTLKQECREQIEAEANFAAGQLLFLHDKFTHFATDMPPAMEAVLRLKETFGNTITTTMWRYIERSRPDLPMVGMVSGHPHPSRRKADFDPSNPCRYMIRSPAFSEKFSSLGELPLFQSIVPHCGAQTRGYLGRYEIPIKDDNGDSHFFSFQTFFNTYEALTLGTYKQPAGIVIALQRR